MTEEQYTDLIRLRDALEDDSDPMSPTICDIVDQVEVLRAEIDTLRGVSPPTPPSDGMEMILRRLAHDEARFKGGRYPHSMASLFDDFHVVIDDMELLGKMLTALTADRDALRAELDRTKGEMERVRRNHLRRMEHDAIDLTCGPFRLTERDHARLNRIIEGCRAALAQPQDGTTEERT